VDHVIQHARADSERNHPALQCFGFRVYPSNHFVAIGALATPS
jgi:hypothetical protein